MGRISSVTDALGNTTSYTYDAADNLTKVTDALGHITAYTYDRNGNLTSETDALGNVTRYSYTPEGWLATVTDGEGNATRYTYDKTGNVLTADCGDRHEENSYNELGKLTTVTTSEGVTEYQYDERGYLISVTEPNGNTVSYTYDEHGNRLSMTYPDGKTVTYSYDSMNRLTAVTGADGKKTTYAYDLLGQRISTDGEKEDTTYTYDTVGNVVSQVTTGKYDVSLAYTYDLSGRMLSESRTEKGTAIESSYVYDALGQITEFTRSDGVSESYTYDPVGNMLTKTAGSIKTNYTYNAANQLVGDGTYKYTYDKIGNLVEKRSDGGLVSYAYNALNLLEKWTDGENTETYTYNAAGLLSTVNTNTSTTALTWDILYGDGVVISAETDGKVTDYTYGLERISAATGKSRTEYVYDGRGSVIGEVAKSGLLSKANVTTKAYTPFGEQIGEKSSGFGWNGEYYNAATGMVYLRARFYEPEMNRFAQKDSLRGSIATPQTLNRYAYCGNNPVNFIDPSGMVANWLKVAAGAVAGAVTGAVVGAVTGGVVGAVVGGIAGGIAGGVAASAATKTSAPPASNPPSTSAQTQAKEQKPTPTPTPIPHPQPTPTPSPSPSPYSPYVTAPDEGSRYACDPQENSPGSTFGRYLLQSLKAFVFGDYSDADATWLSIGGSMAAGIFDVDLPLDVRDFIYDVSHTGELERPVLRIGIDVIAFLPVIGALKYTDDVADVVKQTDNIADAIDGAGDAARHIPYENSRPSFRKGVVEEVWENAKGPDGLVKDPNTGEIIDWEVGSSRNGVWDMGHVPGEKYSDVHDAYMNGELTKEEFLDWYNDPSNYQPELPANNRSHKYE